MELHISSLLDFLMEVLDVFEFEIYVVYEEEKQYCFILEVC